MRRLVKLSRITLVRGRTQGHLIPSPVLFCCIQLTLLSSTWVGGGGGGGQGVRYTLGYWMLHEEESFEVQEALNKMFLRPGELHMARSPYAGTTLQAT